MKTLIAIPCLDTIPVGFAQSLLWLEKGQDVSVLFKPNSLVYDSRNQISLVAMENNFDRVMWFDSDMMFNPDTFRKLSEDMDNTPGCEMVTGLYFKRTGEPLPVIYDELEPPEIVDGKPVKRIRDFTAYPQDDFFTVKGCGFGCVLTSVDLLREVWGKYGPAFNPYPWAGEDISFCYRVNQIGHDIYCDSRISCGHIGTFVYTEETYRKRGDEH